MTDDKIEMLKEREHAILERVGLPTSFEKIHGRRIHFRGENASRPGNFLSLQGTIAALEVSLVNNDDEPEQYSVKLYFTGGSSNLHCLRCDSPHPKRWSVHVGAIVADGTIMFV